MYEYISMNKMFKSKNTGSSNTVLSVYDFAKKAAFPLELVDDKMMYACVFVNVCMRAFACVNVCMYLPYACLNIRPVLPIYVYTGI